jgi:hypothetical protein
MSERAEFVPDWTFDGEVTHVSAKKIASGKTITTLVVTRPDGQYMRLCVCDYWRDLPPGCAEGAFVAVEGRMSGREYQGRHYAGLTAVGLRVLRAAGAGPGDAGDAEASAPVDAPQDRAGAGVAVGASAGPRVLDTAAEGGTDDGLPF